MKELLKFLKSTTNFVTAIVSVSLSLFFWLFRPEQEIPLWCFLISMFLAFFLLWALINSLIALKESVQYKPYSTIFFCSKDTCLCEPTPFLSNGAFVSIYLFRNNCEHQIGYGEVLNIQDNGYISIDLHRLPQSVVSNEPIPFHEILLKYQSDVRIKLTVSRKIIDYIIQEEGKSHEEIPYSKN